MQNLRHKEILDLARSTGRVEVEDLAQRFGVSLQTIRKDLADLSDSGYLKRVHGGALPRQGVSNFAYEERRRMQSVAKAAIAQRCAEEIPNNSSLVLNLGTTTEAVARALLAHENLTVVTNNINVANILMANDSCDIIVAGGNLRRSDGGLVGGLTADFMDQFKTDIAIIGTSALDHEGDLLDYDLAEIRVSRTIIRQSRRAFLVSDASKFTRSAPVRLASLSQLDALFTDAALPDALAQKCALWETAVHVAKPVHDLPLPPE